VAGRFAQESGCGGGSACVGLSPAAAMPRKQPLNCENAVRGCPPLEPGAGGKMPLKAGAGRWSRDICELKPGLFQQVAREVSGEAAVRRVMLRWDRALEDDLVGGTGWPEQEAGDLRQRDREQREGGEFADGAAAGEAQ
jgi:hypothetical protein